MGGARQAVGAIPPAIWAIHATVAAASDPPRPLLDAAIAHRHEHVQDRLLKEVRTRRAQTLQELGCHLSPQPSESSVDLFDGIKRGAFIPCRGADTRDVGPTRRHVIAIRRDLTEMDLVEAPRMLGKKPASCLGD